MRTPLSPIEATPKPIPDIDKIREGLQSIGHEATDDQVSFIQSHWHGGVDYMRDLATLYEAQGEAVDKAYAQKLAWLNNLRASTDPVVELETIYGEVAARFAHVAGTEDFEWIENNSN